MAPGLAFRILSHLEELGLLKQGQVVLDPMAGIFTTGLCASLKGYSAIGIELEEKFVALAQKNIDRLMARTFAGGEVSPLGLPIRILQGDARHLSQLLSKADVVVTSPPYSDSKNDCHHGIKGELSPNLRGRKVWEERFNGNPTNPANIANLKDVPMVGITSPPYSDAQVNAGNVGNAIRKAWKEGQSGPDHGKDGYGQSEGQIASLPDRPLKAITSPPYGDNAERGVGIDWEKAGRPDRLQYSPHRHNIEGLNPGGFGSTSGQIGQEQGQTYLEAMKICYAEIAKVADVLVVVVKNPTRAGKLRRLDLDTIAILEKTGWRIQCLHEAPLFEEQEMGHLFEGSKKKIKGRLSFFKRLSYQKGSPVADHEDIIVCVREGNSSVVALTSPPYQTQTGNPGVQPLITGKGTTRGRGFQKGGDSNQEVFGDTPGQIGRMK